MLPYKQGLPVVVTDRHLNGKQQKVRMCKICNLCVLQVDVSARVQMRPGHTGAVFGACRGRYNMG